MKETNKTYNEKFKTLDTKLGTLENKVSNLKFTKPSELTSSSQSESVTDEKTGLSSVSKGAITIGIIGLLETFIRYVAPLLVS